MNFALDSRDGTAHQFSAGSAVTRVILRVLLPSDILPEVANQDLPTLSNPSRVFISYSWDSDEHKTWMLAFAKRLRDDGIDAIIDQLHLPLGARSPQFMEQSVRECSRVLVVCTEVYKRRFDNREGGAGYEGHIITGEIINEVGENKFIPILRSGDWKTAMPTALSGAHGVDLRLDSDSEYKRLVRDLHGVVEIVPVGPRPTWLHNPPAKIEDHGTVPESADSVSDSLITPDDLLLITAQRDGGIVAWLKNETLAPIEGCGIKLNDLQKYSEGRSDFHRNPFTPIVLIRPITVLGGRDSGQAAMLAQSGQGRFLTFCASSNLRFSDAGIWKVEILVEGGGRSRKDTLFLKWAPGEGPQLFDDPRLSASHSTIAQTREGTTEGSFNPAERHKAAPVNRPRIAFRDWGEIPEGHPVQMRSGQRGFYLVNDGCVAYEVCIERFEIEPSVHARSGTLARIEEKATAFALVWLEGYPGFALATQKWDLVGALTSAAAKSPGGLHGGPDYNIDVQVTYRDADGLWWFQGSAQLTFIKSQRRICFGPTNHKKCGNTRDSVVGSPATPQQTASPPIEKSETADPSACDHGVLRPIFGEDGQPTNETECAKCHARFPGDAGPSYDEL
jgi:hypothetical protein